MKNFFKNLMPMLLLIAGLGISPNLWAGNDWWNTGAAKLTFSKNSSSTTVTLNKTNVAKTTWTGVTSLTLSSIECNLWYSNYDYANHGNVCSAKLYYRIYAGSQDKSKSDSYTEVATEYKSTSDWHDNKYDVVWNKTGLSTNLLSGLEGGKYTFEYYFKATGGTNNGTDCNSSFYLSNNSSNYAIEFTYAKSYTVTLNANGGTINAGNVTSYAYGTGATLPTNVTKTGYRFDGWFDNSDLTGSAVTTISTTATGDKEYWAKWTAKTYSVTLDKNGGSANGSVTATYNGGLSNYSAATHATANLTGYYTATSGGDMVIDATGALISGTVSGWVTDGKWVNTNATQTLHAQWQSEATLSFNKNTTGDVDNMPTSITREPGSVTLPSTEPSRTGYTFKGWDTNKDATTGTYAAGTTFDLQSNTELFAIWQENKYTITVVSWNSSTTVQAGIATNPDVTAATKFGSNFSSWECSEGVSVNGDKVTATKAGTITAVYTQNSDVMYVEGRFRVYTSDAQTTEITTYGAGEDWKENSKNIKFTYDAENARYYLNTFATPKQLSDNIGNNETKYEPYFWINKGTSSATTSTNYKATASSPKFTTAGESNGIAVTTTGTNTPRFNMTDQSGFVTLYFDGSKIWFTVTPVQYTVTFGAKSGFESMGTVTATADGVAISSGASVNRGARVVFTSNPGEGYYCNNWYNNGSSSGSGKTKTIESLTGNVNITADFNEYSYTITMAKNPDAGGTISPNSTQTLKYHTPIAISYTENTGYHFTGWQSSSENVVIADSKMSIKPGITANGTATVTANFEKNKFAVTINHTEGGVTSPFGEQANITQLDGVAITATPETGYYFVNWTKTAGEGSFAKDATIASNNFKPTEAATIQANFTAYVRSLSVTSVNVGKMATVTFTKDEHYSSPTITYELWNENKTAQITDDGTTFTPTETGATFIAQVAGNYTVKAIVTQNSKIVDEVFSNAFTIGAVYTVNFAVSPTGKGCTVTPATPKEDVIIDIPFEISATNGTGYHFNKWVAEPENTFTFEDATTASTQVTMTTAAVTSTITATFSPNTYSVRFNANSPTGQKATGTMEDQSFEYDEAAKALTENAFVRLGYTFLGWATTADGTKEYDDKQAVQNLANESGAIVNLYAVWQLKTDCSITVTQPAAEDGTIAPSTKVTGANVEGTTYTYTFNPKDNSVTFMNWTITNAICVEGTNERSNPVKIKTYGEATIRANVKENLVSVTLKVLPDDYWGYFKVNGNNVASGTVINVGSKTTATVLGKNTNFGYKFDGFEYTEGYSDLITYNEETGEMQGNGNVGKVTIIAKFSVDTNTGWELFGNWDNWKNDIAFEKHPDQNTKKIAYVKKELSAGNYQFKIKKPDGTVMGLSNEGEMNGTYHFGWKFNNSYNQGQVCKFNPTQNSTYVFRLDYTDENNPTVTLLFANHWFPKPTTIYFNNKNFEGEWGSPKVRFGCDGGIAEAYTMSLVPGTANLYSYTFPEGYEYFDFWQIADNYGWTGAKDKTNETTYGFHNIGEDKYKIKCATKDDKTAATTETVVKISSSYDDGSYSVKYFHNTVYNSLDASRYTVTYSTKTLTGGSLKVEQWENYDGSARTELNTGGVKVDQSRWITLTATPEIGYKFVKMSVTTNDGNTENHYQTTWKYAVQQNITAITAEFEQVNKYTFYVKNAASTDATWHKNGETAETRDVYIYYDNAKSGDQKVSYWGWPGLMATPMDDNHEWYKVEMTNAYFTIGNWILNNGVGPDCPQTIHYAAENGVPKFDNASMEGKYYEIYQNGANFNTYELRAATTTPDFYRVITEDGKYTSNVATVGEKVSFFATTAGAKLQKSGESGWTDVPNGSISITEDNVYVATITKGDAISTPAVYTGNYYIRTDGASGKWGEYKDPSKNNAMTYFTPRQGETYSYYWVKNLGKLGQSESSGSFNVKAKVANDYNDNLAGEIANDANTNIYGNINKTTNGSNVRFSYEPTTNAFERAILSGSAEDSYLNIVGANIYSDESCKNEFALNENTYKTNPKACKLRDISDWVYEMTIYAKVPDVNTAIGVDMYSLYNGNRSTLLNDKVIMAKGTGAATYKLRATYDFKKNRITTSWSPSSQTITETMTVNADIQFLQVEKGDVSQITLSKTTDPNVKSLEYLLYVLEIEDPGAGKRKEEHYRISLPFDCRVSDIYGLENYVKLNEAGQPISGDWGIQKYNGELRAQQGWYDNSPIQNFWTWLSKDDTLKAGRGYSVSIDKSAFTWATIGEEVTRTICDANGTNCQDITTTEDRASHRLYFPSMQPGFDLKNSSAQAINYPEIHCEKTQGNRDVYDSDWRFIGSSAYNNITTKTVTPEQSVAPAPAYLYVLNSAETEYEAVAAAENFVYHSFGAYMMQFHGDIEWNIYTQSHPESQAPARRYSAIAHAPLKMHVDVMEGEEMAAQAFVELNDQATTGFDQKMDLTLMKSSKVARAYTTTEGIDYAANCLPFESTIVPMTVNTLHAGDYTLHLEGADNVAVYLIDYQLQTETLISAGDVEVELERGSSSDRFALRFDVAASPTDSKNAKGETITNDGQKTQKLLINDNIYLINAGRVYNVLGARP